MTELDRDIPEVPIMKARFVAWVRKQPVLAFYLLAFAITWLGWLPQAAYSHGLFPFDSIIFYVLGGIGPMLAVYIVLRIQHGPDKAVNDLFAPLLRWKVGIGWYLLAFFSGGVIWFAANALRGELSSTAAELGPLLALVLAYLTYLVAAVPEELAWRGFALPRLQARTNNALAASLIVGVLWALWHIPLLMVKGSVMSTYPLLPYFFSVVAMSVVYAWMFNSTGSALIMVIFHAGINAFGNFEGTAQLAVQGTAAVLLVIVFGAARLAWERRRKTPQSERLSPAA